MKLERKSKVKQLEQRLGIIASTTSKLSVLMSLVNDNQLTSYYKGLTPKYTNATQF